MDPDENHNLAMDVAHVDRLNHFHSQHPKEFASQAMGIKARNLRLRFSGETFEWYPWSGASKKKSSEKTTL
ncbi:hypothetical protein [Gimesia aquarii]|uniref:hypothetical protein n=1 Tax=Gimesia aquarii TaxID=2527964 RepID=UPI0011A93A15|nr:hypothetical protein [Gimesia aquarii]